MKVPLKSVVFSCLALILGTPIIWHFVHAELTARQLAKDAAACRIRAEHGDPDSQLRLGSMYFHGKGLQRNYAEAIRWYRRSAEQGNTQAEYSLCYMYHEGNGKSQDYVETERWCRKAAEQGDEKAQDALGFMYFRGEGVAQDYSQAAYWYRKSAEQGFANARYDLGYMYYNGYGVERDRIGASRLFHEAAVQGSQKAQRAVGWNKMDVTGTSRIVLPLKFLASLFFGAASLKSRRSRLSRARMTDGLSVLFLISSCVLDLIWYFHVGYLQSLTALTTLYFARQLLDGVIVALLAPILLPNSAKVLLIAAAAIFIALIAFEAVRFEFMHIHPRDWFLCFVGLPIGMSIPAAVFLWFDRRRSGRGIDGKGDVAVPVTAK